MSHTELNYLPYGRQQITEDDIASVVSVLKSDFLTQGPIVPKFEKKISNLLDVEFTLAVTNATSALHLACLALGLKKTASSFFVIKNPKPDSGDIISQKTVHIKKNYNAEILYKKIMDVAKNQIKEIMEKIENNEKIKLKKNFKSNYWRKRTNLDGKIDWRMSAKLIHNLVRALDKPYMHPHFTNDNFEFKIIKSKIIMNFCAIILC